MSYKDKYADQIQAQFYKLEDRICADIVRRIKKTGEITSTADWQINKLSELGYSSAEIEDMIRETLKATYPDIFELYDKAIDWEYVRNRKLYEQINAEYVPFEDNMQLQQLLQTAKAQTQASLVNLTQSLGVVQQIGGQFTFLPLTEFYQTTLDAAVFDITSGAFDYNSVLKRTVATLSRSGIRSIDYASGRSSRVAVAARRAVLTGLSQMTGEISRYNAEKLGTDYFEIDRHDGARPTHRPWQGKVWSSEELVSVCGLGTVTGLNGANCYHIYFPFIPGISKRNYTDEELKRLDALEDEKKYFRGKEYDAYEARQKQRQMETAMRAQRVHVRGLERGGADPEDIIIAKARYQGQLAEYKAFCDAMKVDPQMNRVYIDGLGRVVSGRRSKISPLKGRETPKISAKKMKSPDVADNRIYKELTLDEFKEMHHNITKAERSVIYGKTHLNGYLKSSNARKMNAILREGKALTQEYSQIADVLSGVISKNTIPEDIMVTRYVDIDALESTIGVKAPKTGLSTTKEAYLKELSAIPNKVKKGHIYTEKGFLSTSGVFDKNVMQNRGIVLNIKVPAGTKGYISTNYRESEIIFDRGSKLEIKDVNITDGNKVIIDCVMR